MEIKNREKLLMLLVGVGLALLLCDHFVFSPLIATYHQRADRIAALRKNIEQGRALIQRQSVIEERWDRMRTNALPANPSQAESAIFLAFDRWGRNSGVAVSSVKPQWKDTDEDYSAVECRAEAVGNITGVTRFLYEIENDPMGIKLNTIEVASRDDNGAQLNVSLEVSGLVLGTTNSDTQ